MRTSGSAGSASASEAPRACGGGGEREMREKSARASPITSALLCGGRCAKLGSSDEGGASTGDDEDETEAASSMGFALFLFGSATKGAMERLKGGLYAAYA